MITPDFSSATHIQRRPWPRQLLWLFWLCMEEGVMPPDIHQVQSQQQPSYLGGTKKHPMVVEVSEFFSKPKEVPAFSKRQFFFFFFPSFFFLKLTLSMLLVRLPPVFSWCLSLTYFAQLLFVKFKIVPYSWRRCWNLVPAPGDSSRTTGLDEDFDSSKIKIEGCSAVTSCNRRIKIEE